MLSSACLAVAAVLCAGRVAADTSCSPDNQCPLGCCSISGKICGFGPDYCAPATCNAAASANGTCNQLAECDPGVFPGWGETWGPQYAAREGCPLNVCCSKFGFCGTTEEFCGDSSVSEPSCSGSSATGRTIGYYEGWALTRPCDAMAPEDIPVGAFTHLNFGFLSIDPGSFAVVPEDPSEEGLYARFTALKRRKPGLQTWLSIGGWAFNDPGPTQTTFSDLAGSSSAQQAFFQSLVAFMQKYGFDGVDIDWEYPVTVDRSGRPADFQNYPRFLSNLRAALDATGHRYGLTITLPSSYFYMQDFDIVSIEKSIDWFNVMTYDLHGTWDATDPFIGNIMLAHTNLTEIRQTMDLLWRNNIDPAKVTMGLGFYGRSFTAQNPDCIQSGCPFIGGGAPGQCTQSSGTLSYTEIERIIKAGGASVLHDEAAAVKVVTWGGNQWVSFDDAETLQDKLAFANAMCLGGTMVWAVSLDTTGAAAAALTGAGDLFPGSDGSGDGNDVFLPPSVWDGDGGGPGQGANPVQCEPPCTIILPPSPVSPPVVVTWPPVTTAVTTSGGGTSSTTIAVPPFTVSAVPFWPVTIASGDTAGTITPRQSVLPPTPVIVTLPGSATLVPTSSGIYSINPGPVETPSGVQPGTVAGCTQWYQTVSGDSCSAIADKFGISVTAFEDWNPVVGKDCTNLWLDQYYCVGGPVGSVPTPSPIAGGTPPGCTRWYQAQSGDSCSAIESRFHITDAAFYNLNQAVGPGCSNGILLGFYYCISSGPLPTTGGVQRPTFYSTSHAVTIQPMPTVSVPGLQPPPPLPFKPGPPSGYTPGDGSTPPPGGPPPSGGNGPNGEEPPPCAGCGTTGCRLFGCGHKCGLFGCDGGCGIGFCGGGCGLEGCGPGCGDGKCGIPHGGGGGLPPPGALPTDGDGDDGDDDDCDEENTADDCVEYVYPTTILGQSTATTQTHCEQTTGCSVTATTTTTTITDSSCPLITALPGMPSGFSLGPDGPTVTVAHLTATFTFDGPLASVWGSVATFDIGTAGVTHSSAPQPTPPSSPQPPQCPMGRPDASDCESILFSMGNAQTPIPGSQACYSGTTNNAEWRWCDYYTSGTCQISLGYQTQFGWPFEKSLPSVAFVHEKAADIFASNANCNSGSQDWVDPDISNLDFLVCLKRTGYNCWVSIPQ